MRRNRRLAHYLLDIAAPEPCLISQELTATVDVRRPDATGPAVSGVGLESLRGRFLFHVMFNSYWEPLTFELPTPADGRRWQRCIDTAQASPDDIRPLVEAPAVAGGRYVVEPRSVVLLAMALLEHT